MEIFPLTYNARSSSYLSIWGGESPMDEFLCSIIVPVYNASAFLLTRCLATFSSILYQDIEVILSDDGSAEQTVSVLRQLAASSETPMRVLTAPTNGGQNVARNRGITAAHGRYVMFLDSDDYFDEHEFAQVLEAIRNSVADEEQSPDVFVYGCKRVDGNTGLVIDGYGPAEGRVGVVPNSLVIRNVAELWGCVIRRDLLLAEPLRTGIAVGEDLISVIPVIAKASKIVALPFSPYRYVQQSESVMHSASAERRMQIVPAFQSMLEELGPEILAQYHDELEWQAIWHILFWEPLHALQSVGKPNYAILNDVQSWMMERFPRWRRNPYVKTDSKARGLTFRIITSGHYRLYRFLYLAKRRLHKSR